MGPIEGGRHDELAAGQAWCFQCEGTGHGPCANCGDTAVIECACDEPEETECDVCDGTGRVQEDE